MITLLAPLLESHLPERVAYTLPGMRCLTKPRINPFLFCQKTWIRIHKCQTETRVCMYKCILK